MRREGAQLRLSATDLAGHLGCQHLTSLDVLAADGKLKPPVWKDPVVELLRELEVPVVVSRTRSAQKAGDRAPLVVAEPRLPRDFERGSHRFHESLAAASRVILVLPKRWATPKPPSRSGSARSRFIPTCPASAAAWMN